MNGDPFMCHVTREDGSASRLYEDEALKHRVKYCRLVRKPVGSSWHYYVQLVLEGTAPVKHSLGSGRAGLDIGTSTAAVATRQECILTVLGESVEDIEKEQRRQLRKIDRSRRAMNPQNYNPDGTVRKGGEMDPQRPLPQDAHGIRLPLPETGGGPEAMAGGYGKPDRKPMRHPVCGEMNFKALQRRAKPSSVKENGKTHQEETVREEPADPGPKPSSAAH